MLPNETADASKSMMRRATALPRLTQALLNTSTYTAQVLARRGQLGIEGGLAGGVSGGRAEACGQPRELVAQHACNSRSIACYDIMIY